MLRRTGDRDGKNQVRTLIFLGLFFAEKESYSIFAAQKQNGGCSSVG